jgi:hypothetical protein
VERRWTGDIYPSGFTAVQRLFRRVLYQCEIYKSISTACTVPLVSTTCRHHAGASLGALPHPLSPDGGAVQCSAVQCRAVQCSAVLCSPDGAPPPTQLLPRPPIRCYTAHCYTATLLHCYTATVHNHSYTAHYTTLLHTVTLLHCSAVQCYTVLLHCTALYMDAGTALCSTNHYK